MTLSNFRILFFLFIAVSIASCATEQNPRLIIDFNQAWQFSLGDTPEAINESFDDSDWRKLNVPHDWSIEGEFSPEHPATTGGGALPGGVGWYRKHFSLTEQELQKQVFIQFDGVYMNSEVWINGQYLGKRPFGYISFEYDLTPYLNPAGKENVLAVRVDNSQQPNSRWYSGSGIYRDTRLVLTDQLHVPIYGTFVTTPEVTNAEATVSIETKVQNNHPEPKEINVRNCIVDAAGKKVCTVGSQVTILGNAQSGISHQAKVIDPMLWSLDQPNLYTLITEIKDGDQLLDRYETTFGIRYFDFDQKKGFKLNGEQVKIQGVCLHHDLGCLGAAYNRRAMQRQLEIMRDMGVNAIRTAHNPPASDLLDLCDEMGFFVMDETFDIWSMKKSPYDYSLYWEEWHEKDLKDHILRDRNHPSVFVWSIGNEIVDQWHDVGEEIAVELAEIVKALDATRPITAAMNPPSMDGNSIARSGALDLIGYNYHHQMYAGHKDAFPNTPFIATETTSALATRGYYDAESDTLKRWPIRWDLEFTGGNPGNTVSAYDQVSAPWGSTHEETWKVMKAHEFLSGMFIWTGFDYLGEPTPYTWPSRSSYFGVVDLAGFPKDSYYMYQSEWTDEDVLHVFPHWNWSGRDSVDVWAYFSGDEVELWLNGKSMGTKTKTNGEMHVMWRLPYEPGELKAISRTSGQLVLEKVVKTAGAPKSIRLTPDKMNITADGKDLSFVTVELLDDTGYPVPNVTNEITFSVGGNGTIAGVDNGDPTSHLSLKGNKMKVFNGKCLVVVQSTDLADEIMLTASTDGIPDEQIVIRSEE